MSAGNPGFFLRSSLIRRALCRRGLPAHDASTFRFQSTTAEAMLGRANKTYEANPPPRRNELSRQLFPSSSPGTSQNASIVDSFKGPSQPAAASASVSARNAGFADSRPRPPTITSFANPRNGPASRTTSMTSLLSKGDSFREEPDIVNQNTRQPKSVPVVFFNEDDFSDDDNLDFQQPSALPSLPKPAPGPQPLQEAKNPPFPSSKSEVAIPWSSSPASHKAPVLSRTASTTLSNARGLKRPSQENLETPQQPPAKKRTLPSGWRKEEPIELEDDADENLVHEREPSRKDSLPWNTTASAVKEQKKQFKNLVKKIELEQPTAPTTSMGEIRRITSAASTSKGITLSQEQERIRDLVVQKGQSVFFTGPAGTGKSVLMRAIITALKRKFARDPERLAVTASTGLAACNIGGITLHSFSGIGLGKEDVPQLVKKIRRNPKAKNRWLRTKVLIIDEISMVDGELFDKLSQIGRQLRNNGRPWGGIQLVITGDFFQLPPVPDYGNDNKKKESKFAFDANTWNTSIDHTIGLTQVFRQKDPVFANMLNEMRLGRISDETVAAFQQMSRAIVSDGALELDTTELFPTRNEVEAANQNRMRNLPGKPRRFDAHDSGDPAIRDKLLQNMMAPKSLELKVGAQVMLVKNMDDNLVNGSLGKVKCFMTEQMFDIKGGMDYDDGLGETDSRLKKRIQAFTKEYEDSKKGNTEFPVVEFSASDGTTRTLLCCQEEWKVELPTGEIQASRSQVPLILAWALSIHKAQGQTLERVKVDLGKVFEKGQAYVALSRATTQHGLQVLRFQKHKVMAHPRVVEFYNQLYSIEQAEAKRAPMKVTDFARPKDKALAKEADRMAAFVKKTSSIVDLDEDEELAMMEAHGY